MNVQELTPEIISELKSQYSDPLMTYSEKRRTNPQKFVFKQISHELMRRIRRLVRDEALNNGNLLPLEQVESLIFNECVVWPTITEDDKLNYQVGFVPQIVKNIQEVSGFLDVDVLDRPLRPTEFVEVVRDFQYWGDVSDSVLEQIKLDVPFNLFKININRWTFVVRPLTKGDVLALTNSQDEELVGCKSVTVWPTTNIEWETNIPGGVIKTLWSSIMEISGFSSESEVVEL